MFMALFTAGYFILFLPIIDQAFRGAPIGPVANTFIIIAWVVAFIISVILGDFTAKKARAGKAPSLFTALFILAWFLLFSAVLGLVFRFVPMGPVSDIFAIIAYGIALIASIGLGNFTAKKARDGSQT